MGRDSTSQSVTLSLEMEAFGGMFSSESSTSFEREFDRTETKTSELAKGVQFDAPWLDGDPSDYVIYLVSEYTSYEYEILAAPDPAAVGTFMTIDVPQQENQYARRLSAYNAAVEDPDRRIGSETFVHTPGEPSSYRTQRECDDLIGGGAKDDTLKYTVIDYCVYDPNP